MNYVLKLVTYLSCFVITSNLNAHYPSDRGEFLKYTTVLSIGGSDPSGGAGIQADLKTFSALSCYGMSAITALTAQNTVGLQAIQTLPSEFIITQLRSISEDIEVNAIKIGMLERKEIIQEVAKYLKEDIKLKCPIVVDPVMFAKSGDQLIKDEAIQALKDEILPLATILTPNIHEACCLLQIPQIISESEMEKAAFALLELGPQAVIIKGIKDCLVIKGHPNSYWIQDKYIATDNVHGTGCTFSAAIASFLAKKEGILSAVNNAKKYITNAIEAGSKYKLGQGKGPVCHFFSSNSQISFVQEAWDEIHLIYEEIKAHQFIKDLSNGVLSDHVFESYIQQDYLFLLDREKAFSILALRAPNLELKEYLQELAYKSKKAAEEIFNKYGFQKPDLEKLQKTSACTQYTEDMLTAASQLSFNEGLVFLLPCTLIYQKIGEFLKSNSHGFNRYQNWIDQYSSLDRRNRTEIFINIIEELAASSVNEKEALKAVFKRAAEHEYDFWDAVYR